MLILMLEDDADVAACLFIALERLGHSAVHARSVREANDLINREPSQLLWRCWTLISEARRGVTSQSCLLSAGFRIWLQVHMQATRFPLRCAVDPT